MMDNTFMSANKPGLSVPDVNRFVIARSKIRGTGMEESSRASAVLPDGSRRTAAASVADLLWNTEGANEEGDCLMDCFARFAEKPRGAVSWKAIRNDIADQIDSIAEKIDISGPDGWVDCFQYCEEDPLARALEASPINPDAAPFFNSPGCTGALAARDGMASSSSSGIESIVYAVKPHDDPIANTTCAAADAPAETCAAADAPADEKANDDPPAKGKNGSCRVR